MSPTSQNRRVLLGACVLVLLAGVVVAGIIAFTTATAEQTAGLDEAPASAEQAEGEGFEHYGQIEYVPVAQDNANTLMWMFGGIGLLAAVVIVIALMARRRERERD